MCEQKDQLRTYIAKIMFVCINRHLCNVYNVCIINSHTCKSFCLSACKLMATLSLYGHSKIFHTYFLPPKCSLISCICSFTTQLFVILIQKRVARVTYHFISFSCSKMSFFLVIYTKCI